MLCAAPEAKKSLSRTLRRFFPSCTRHGAMARVSGDRQWWRCLACGLGVVWHPGRRLQGMVTVLRIAGSPDSIGFDRWPRLTEGHNDLP